MIITAMLRVKNAGLTIAECLFNLSCLVDSIVIVDNGSTDGTKKIYKQFPKITVIEKTKGFNEGRDRNRAFILARKQKPDWIIVHDADEVYEKALTRKRLEKWCKNSGVDCLGVRNFHFWLSKTHYRVDPRFLQYTSWPQSRIFKNKACMYFSKKKMHSKFVRGYKKMIYIPYRLKHYGYISQQQIKDKLKLYQSLNLPENDKDMAPFQLNYPHIKLKRWQKAPTVGVELYLKTLRWYWRFMQFTNPIQRKKSLENWRKRFIGLKSLLISFLLFFAK